MIISDFNIIELDSVDSTNNFLKNLLKKGVFEPTIVIAKEQTGGRGTKNRTFISEKGGLYLSILLKPFDAKLITPLTAVAVSDTVKQISGKETQIKWVNDIYLNSKKLAGILCESVYPQNADKPYIIVGIGINLFKPQNDFDKEIKDTAISLFDKQDGEIRGKFITALINNFLFYLENYKDKTFLKMYQEKNFLIGKKVKVLQNNYEFEALATEIDDDCHLKVKLPDGSIKTLVSGEIILKKL